VTRRRDLALKAVRAALQMRSAAGYQPWQPAAAFDLAQTLGIETRFVDIPSLEGMYWKKAEPVILVAAERPPGRQAFTCAHELGHHAFGHGNKIDQVLEESSLKDPEEYLADVFAAFLLMPKTAVLHAFSVRALNPRNASPSEVFIVAGWLGVGYGTLARHLQSGLGLITARQRADLLKVQPKTIKRALLGKDIATDVTVVDDAWTAGRAIDVQVGDFVMAPSGTSVTGPSVGEEAVIMSNTVFNALKPGVSRLCRPTGWSAYLRVSRRRFIGRSLFRHLEEPPDD